MTMTETTTKLPTSAHLEAVANAAIQSYLPEGWHIHWLKDEDYKLSGGMPKKKILEVAHPHTAGLLLVLLHELGHLKAHDPGNQPIMGGLLGMDYLNPPHAECIASHWAKAYMEAHNIAVPPECWNEARQMWQNEEINRGEPLTKD